MSTKKILIVVDMQVDFIDGALGSKEAATIVSPVCQKIETARQNGDILIFTRDTHHEDYLDTEEGKHLPVPHCLKDSAGWQIDKRLPIAEGDTIIDKPTFGSLALGNLLQQKYSSTVESIEFIGLCTDICVLSNAVIAKAALPDVPIVVDAACCAGVTPESHDTALAAMKTIQVNVLHQGQEPWRK
ncbi:Nicotinamidase-related amidase [Selenomonas ruminantium]|uniref:Nicotinamidase-related amidase n=1 Tax=Selenomonas ruminantium TaxID=971 RepID=A0A1I3ENY1_SELRU|nr:isochorismatase family cysteine hydrolase [Selenomonas ruminantium]SFI00695.1 Nicotinamidase-related amidase [Selenomonas ruminantium]